MHIFTVILISTIAVSLFMGAIFLFMFYLWGFPPALTRLQKRVISANLPQRFFQSIASALVFGIFAFIFTVIIIHYGYDAHPEEELVFISMATGFAAMVGFILWIAITHDPSKSKEEPDSPPITGMD